MKNRILGGIFLGAVGVTLVTLAHAEPTNLFQCVDRGFILQECKLQQVEFAKAGIDNGAPFETEYAVTYDFPCFGNSTSIGVRSGQDVRYFRMGAQGETLTGIHGREALSSYDPDPQETARLSYRPGCSLSVRSVTALPSNNTILLWTTEAKSQARIIGLARDLYLLSKNFVAIATFNLDQLAVVIDATDKRVAASTTSIERRRWLALYDSLVATRDGQPIPVPKEQFETYLNDLAAHARTDLLNEADKGRAMVQRSEKWQQVVEASLKEILDSLPAM